MDGARTERIVTGMAFDVRAMENIATAPASDAERVAGRWAAAAAIVVFLVTLPVAGVRWPAVAAVVPAVVGAAVLSEFLTALLFYVQYRIARSAQLALLAIAYAAAAFLTLFYILTFPDVFAPHGLFRATLQTAAWASALEHVLFGGFIAAFAIVSRYDLHVSRPAIRWLALATAIVVGAVAIGTIVLPLPHLLDAHTHTTPFFSDIVEPVQFTVYGVALALLIFTRRQTVTHVWLVAVVVLRVMESLAVGAFASGRYTVFWYLGRTFVLIAASIMLGVFIVKLNDLLLRLARRNRALTERTEVAELEIAQGELRYRTLANVVPQLIWSANADGEIDYVNDRWIVYTGLDAQETRAVGWRGALDERQPTTLHDAWHESLRSGAPFSGEYLLREGGSGRLRWFLINAIAIRAASGGTARWIGSCTDIDQQKRIEEREVFLARAGDRLSASLDMNATLDTIADLVVGRMGTWARVDLLDAESRFVPVTVASSLPEEELALRGLLGRPAGGALERVFADALARREPLVDGERDVFAGDVAGVRAGTAIVVPLTSGDTALGALTLVRDDRQRPEADEIAVARDFGRRAAQALDHARLYERERSTADALQRAMLPQVLPQFPNVTFSASYSAASESQRVGGDFYDAFVLPDGRVALTIGDVTGHGLEAAVIMGEIRQALRAASFERAEPAVILDRASTLLVASGRSVFVTAVFGVLDTRTGRFEYASAGHPAPLVYDGTKLLRLATSGLPIGLRDDEGVDFALTLPPQCTIVLYTDGLLEFSRDLDEGERRIERAIRELDVDDIDHLAGAIMKRVLRDDQPSDDIAILTATLGDLPRAAPGETREWRFRSTDGGTATLVRHEIGTLVAAWTERDEARLESELVFGELFSNVVRHAPGALEVHAARTAEGAELVVRDFGSGLPAVTAAAGDFAESGRGLQLVRTLGDTVAIEPAATGTRIAVGFQRAAAARSTGKSSALSSA
jgi:PAS domain S-box-containing protein